MSVNLDALKARLGELQNTNSNRDSLWKPEPGKTQIRIVPYKFDKENPFIELYFHYGLGNKIYLSPVSFGKPDPVEKFSNKLKSTGNKEDWILGKKLEPKMRTFAPVVIRGRESEGVKFWGFGKTVYQELLGFMTDPDYGDITDPINGRDVVIEKITPAEAGNQYGKTNIRVKPQQTPITEDKGELENIFNSQRKINEIYTEPSYEELENALQEFLNPSDEENSSNETPTKSESTTDNKTATVNNVGDAFDELFNN
tara:strand:- start:190 stop:957 length:768 start_codon:yes stop_codon:yes gene_type:complete